MKVMNQEEQKEEMVKMLKYIDAICRQNNLKYTLIGGSLIGAIRHKGMIPWDDDIDIALLKEDYDKLVKILKEDSSNDYALFDPEVKGYYYPYAKLIAKNTILIEENKRKIEGYGLFVDIFPYNNFPKEKKEQERYYRKMMRIKKMINGYLFQGFPKGTHFKLLKRIKRLVPKLIGIKTLLNIYQEEFESMNGRESTLLMSNWPIYSKEKEIQKKENFKEYIDVNFEGINVMIIKNYDDMLRTTFGDYMKLPPVEERISKHFIRVYRRD